MDIESLASLSGTTRRNIRFYIQRGLLPAPQGERRAARYDERHLERLLAIRRLQQEGMTLDGIARRLEGEQAEPDFIPPQPGSVEVWSRMHLRDGIELHIHPGRARLDSAQLAELARFIDQRITALQANNQEDSGETR